MLCQKCKKNTATTHIRSVVNGVVHEKHLCSLCAANEGYSNIKNNNLSQMLSSMFEDTSESAPNNHLARCSCCGLLFSDIATSGKCGCPECYEAFYEQLEPYFKRVHGSTKHIGKKPANFQSEQPKFDKIDKINELRYLLNNLVKEENYEQAAVIRDQIKQLEGEK